MKSIYILLTRSNTFVSNLVKIATADRYTHVSISFDQSLDPLYSFARHYTYLALPAGLRTEYLDRGFFKRYPRIPCALYELTVEDEAYEKAKKAVEDMMEESEKYKFNVLGLFLCRLSIPSRRKDPDIRIYRGRKG